MGAELHDTRREIDASGRSLPPGKALGLGFRKNNYHPAAKQEPAIGKGGGM